MSFIAAAVITGGAALAGGILSSNAAGRAANKQLQASQESNATQKAMYDKTREDNMPALDARNASLQRMRELLGIGGDAASKGYGSLGGGINPGDVQNEAGYQFGLNQGLTAQSNHLGARGMRNSGAAIKAATRYGNDYATTKYDNAFNRIVANRSAQLNPLQSLAGASQTGASTVANSGNNYANTVSGNQTALGNALGANSLAQGNIWGGALNQIGSAAKGWYSGSQIDGFNGNALTGYTYKNPEAVGPMQP
jgi:hypothetical protein